jgi:hypothetical protein
VLREAFRSTRITTPSAGGFTVVGFARILTGNWNSGEFHYGRSAAFQFVPVRIIPDTYTAFQREESR